MCGRIQIAVMYLTLNLCTGVSLTAIHEMSDFISRQNLKTLMHGIATVLKYFSQANNGTETLRSPSFY